MYQVKTIVSTFLPLLMAFWFGATAMRIMNIYEMNAASMDAILPLVGMCVFAAFIGIGSQIALLKSFKPTNLH